MVTSGRSQSVRRKRPDTRRQELLDAALDLFMREGVAAPTVADIARAAGAAKGTFYLYFPTKADLLAALQQQFTDDLVTLLEQRSARHRSFEHKLNASIAAAIEFHLEHSKIHDVLFHSGSAAAASPLQDFLGWMAGFIQQGVDAGEFIVRDLQVTAVFVYSAFHGVLDELIHDPAADPRDVAKTLKGLLAKVLRP